MAEDIDLSRLKVTPRCIMCSKYMHKLCAAKQHERVVESLVPGAFIKECLFKKRAECYNGTISVEVRNFEDRTIQNCPLCHDSKFNQETGCALDEKQDAQKFCQHGLRYVVATLNPYDAIVHCYDAKAWSYCFELSSDFIEKLRKELRSTSFNGKLTSGEKLGTLVRALLNKFCQANNWNTWGQVLDHFKFEEFKDYITKNFPAAIENINDMHAELCNIDYLYAASEYKTSYAPCIKFDGSKFVIGLLDRIQTNVRDKIRKRYKGEYLS